VEFESRLIDLIRSYLRVQMIVIVVFKVQELWESRRAYMHQKQANLIGKPGQHSRDYQLTTPPYTPLTSQTLPLQTRHSSGIFSSLGQSSNRRLQFICLWICEPHPSKAIAIDWLVSPTPSSTKTKLCPLGSLY